MNAFKIKTENFEGPLDILLDLIEKRKFFINDLSLSKVADDFIEYVKSMGQFPMEESSDFILVAATLLLIKSKSLLPNLSLTEEEKGNIEDLERRLNVYKIIKEVSVQIKEKFGLNIIFAKSEIKNRPVVFAPDQSITQDGVHTSILEVIQNFPKKETMPKVSVKPTVNLEEMIVSLTERIKKSFKMSFHEFSKYGKSEKVNVIISFLAMLELVKQGIINVRQDDPKGDIHMETDEVGTPRYGE